MRPATPRVALGGIMLESNAFAPPASEADFRARCNLTGNALMAEARRSPSTVAREMSAFVQTMDLLGPWTSIPTLLTDTEPKGPVDQAFFRATVDAIVTGIAAALPLDAVYLSQHGAMVASEDHDPDGELIERVRQAVGPDVAIVVTLDLHANVSDRMVAAADILIGYQTNPHVDMAERGEEAALATRTLLSGVKARAAFRRLPLFPPTVTLLTAEGPYGRAIDYAQRRKRETGGTILNVSILGGFAFSDSPKCGLSIVVTARDEQAEADALADELAEKVWSWRQEFQKPLTALDDAVALAVARGRDPSLPATIVAEVADNPGGGAGGNTTWLLAALVEAGARSVLMGSFVDSALAGEAHELGIGGRFQARFNRAGETEQAKEFAAAARVVALADGDIVGRLGIYKDSQLRLGPAALLEIGGEGGVQVAVISDRQQTADPLFFEQFGIDIGAARTVCVKSRGHFRAGFAPWFGPAQVIEVDTPGLTSPVLSRFDWRHLPRPVFPLDPDADCHFPGPAGSDASA